MLFKKKLRLVTDQEIICNEPISKLPQLYRADFHFLASLEDGKYAMLSSQLFDLTQEAAGQFEHVSIDSRSHMLMTNMYPCIPGWHCDDFYRPEGPLSGQPDLENVMEKAPQRHFLFVLGTNSRTEFVDENVYLPSPAEIHAQHGTKEPIYYHYDKMIEELQAKKGYERLRTTMVEPNKLYEFGPHDFHRGSPATEPGWRYFLRITYSHHRKPKNELRYQTQVYTTGRVSW